MLSCESTKSMVLVDTRTKPTSKWATFATARTLKGLTQEEGIEYVFMGDVLGGKPSDPSSYDKTGKPDYGQMRSKISFKDAVAKLMKMAESSKVALICLEDAEDQVQLVVYRCHRPVPRASTCQRPDLQGPPCKIHGCNGCR